MLAQRPSYGGRVRPAGFAERRPGTRREDSLFMINLRTYGLAAAGAAATASAFELVRVLASGGVARGQTSAWSIAEAAMFSGVLALTALGLALHRQFGWIAGTWSVVIALSYGVVLRAAGNTIGILYILLGPVLLALLVKSLPYYRTEVPA